MTALERVRALAAGFRARAAACETTARLTRDRHALGFGTAEGNACAGVEGAISDARADTWATAALDADTVVKALAADPDDYAEREALRAAFDHVVEAVGLRSVPAASVAGLAEAAAGRARTVRDTCEQNAHEIYEAARLLGLPPGPSGCPRGALLKAIRALQDEARRPHAPHPGESAARAADVAGTLARVRTLVAEADYCKNGDYVSPPLFVWLVRIAAVSGNLARMCFQAQPVPGQLDKLQGDPVKFESDGWQAGGIYRGMTAIAALATACAASWYPKVPKGEGGGADV